LEEPAYEGWQEKMVFNLANSLSQTDKIIRERVYKVFELVHSDLSKRVRDATEMMVTKANMVPRGTNGSLRL
jgi:catalase